MSPVARYLSLSIFYPLLGFDRTDERMGLAHGAGASTTRAGADFISVPAK
jgi:hypothetical protein